MKLFKTCQLDLKEVVIEKNCF